MTACADEIFIQGDDYLQIQVLESRNRGLILPTNNLDFFIRSREKLLLI